MRFAGAMVSPIATGIAHYSDCATPRNGCCTVFGDRDVTARSALNAIPSCPAGCEESRPAPLDTLDTPQRRTFANHRIQCAAGVQQGRDRHRRESDLAQPPSVDDVSARCAETGYRRWPRSRADTPASRLARCLSNRGYRLLSRTLCVWPVRIGEYARKRSV